MACDGSENWLYSSDSRERLLPLLSLFVDLPAGRGSVQTEWDGGHASVSSGAGAAEFAAEPWRRQLPPSVYPIFV